MKGTGLLTFGFYVAFQGFVLVGIFSRQDPFVF